MNILNESVCTSGPFELYIFGVQYYDCYVHNGLIIECASVWYFYIIQVEGTTALMIAASEGEKEIVASLLGTGTDVNLMNKVLCEGET